MKRGEVSRLLMALVMVSSCGLVSADPPDARFGPRAERPPRKVIVATSIYGPYGDYPGLEPRLKVIGEIVDDMARKAGRQHAGRGLDLAILPETIVSPNRGNARERAIPLKGRVQEALGALARKHGTYLLAPMDMQEDGPTGSFASNAAVLFDRKGAVAGIYRKAHPVAVVNTDELENGITPGKDYPVFECDFGRLGVQICWDIQFPEGWKALADGGAEIVAWPTASPQTVLSAARAAANRYYLVSATWRDNATVYEPTGMVAARLKPPGRVLVHEIDLSYAILGWSSFLKDGEALREKYGDKVGFHYSRREDMGLFWSNDPATPIAMMVRSIGGEELDPQIARNRRLYAVAAKEKTPVPSVRLDRPSDRIRVEPSASGVALTVDSASGIGGASVEPGPVGWPSRLSVHLKLRGLESLKICNGVETIRLSAGATPGASARLVRVRRDGTEEPLEQGPAAEIGPRPADGGGFEFQVPRSLLAANPARITLEWIDFHR